MLRDTKRLGEAEPLSKRGLGILLKFTRNIGHKHPHLGADFRNYAGLLTEMGLPEEEVGVQLDSLVRDCGLEPESLGLDQ